MKRKPLMENTSRNISANETVDQKWSILYTLSGSLLILTAVLSFAAAYDARILYASGYPSDPAAYLQLVAQHQTLAATTWGLWIVMDFLGLAPTVAMYIILQRHNRTLALLGGLLSLAYSIYDFGVTELNSLTLVSLSHEYALAASETLRAPLLAAATYGYYALPLETVLSFAIGPLAYLLWCVPMARSFFGRWVAIVGVMVNIIGILGSAAPLVPSSYFLGLCQFLCVRLIALWFIWVGVKLFRYGRRVHEPAGS